MLRLDVGDGADWELFEAQAQDRQPYYEGDFFYSCQEIIMGGDWNYHRAVFR